MAEQASGERDVAALQRLARRRRGDGVETAGLVPGDALDDLDAKAEPRALAFEEIRVAAPALAETKVVAGDDRGDAQPPARMSLVKASAGSAAKARRRSA